MRCAAPRRARSGARSSAGRFALVERRLGAAVPIQSLWTAIIVVFMWFILNRHRFGEHTLFIGDSNEVSRVVGIDVDREKIKLFTLMGFLAAVAAIFLTLENKNYFGNQGQGYLLIAIASVLIGGTSIFGGRATIIGTVFGCFIIAMVEPGLVATGLTGAWVNTVRGLIFLISIIFYLYVDEPQRRARVVRALHADVSASAGRDRPNERRGSASTGRRRRNDKQRERNHEMTRLLLAGAARRRWCRRRRSPTSRSARALTMYMQMGGNAGDGATLARQTGAAQAAAALGVDLKAQFSAWEPETMINQFKEAVAAKPTCIEIMGHPGSTAFHDLVKAAVDQGIVVTVGNSPMTDLQKEFGTKGMGYAGVDLYAGGALTANSMLAQGLKAGDEAMVYGVFSQAERGQSEKGLADTLEKAGLKVDRREISQEVNCDEPRCADPRRLHPGASESEGDRHRSMAASPAFCAEALQEGGQEAGRHHRRRHRPRPADHRRAEVGLCLRDARPAPLHAGLHAGRAVRDDRRSTRCRD